MATKVKVGVLGATGAVGQRFLQQLEGHKQFEVHALGASDRSSGKTYKAAARWLLSSPLPPCFSDMIMWPCDVTTKDTPFKECKIVFSALDSSVAGDIELSFASHGVAVFSNAKNHRYEKDVPILVPSVNPDHLNMIKYQQEVRGWDSGFIVTNPNCSTSGLVVALKPIDVCFGIDECVVFTMQAVSGAGYPGVASLDILDNVVPFIDGEEDKLELESRKILGQISSSTTTSLSSMAFTPQPFKISAHTNRVPVIDGHTEDVCFTETEEEGNSKGSRGRSSLLFILLLLLLLLLSSLFSLLSYFSCQPKR
eukprot:TRINITY_DN1125_c0_g3_i2.p1 TRINITY_DN1125_c0_g3~~TRINITY_DN1125_c0_g3_i2.p1  ORF type:complete len:310 (+),score=115.08 TRINITY_DN1125_c0_g3_i2:104-1033(+)